MTKYALRTFSEGKEELISLDATEENVLEAVNAINWNIGINFVIIESTDKETSLEVSGSTKEGVGLSSSYKRSGDVWVSVFPPKSVRDLEDLLIYFLRDDRKWQKHFNLSAPGLKAHNISPQIIKNPIMYLLGPFFITITLILLGVFVTFIDFLITKEASALFGIACVLIAAGIISFPILFLNRVLHLLKLRNNK